MNRNLLGAVADALFSKSFMSPRCMPPPICPHILDHPNFSINLCIVNIITPTCPSLFYWFSLRFLFRCPQLSLVVFSPHLASLLVSSFPLSHKLGFPRTGVTPSPFLVYDLSISDLTELHIIHLSTHARYNGPGQ